MLVMLLVTSAVILLFPDLLGTVSAPFALERETEQFTGSIVSYKNVGNTEPPELSANTTTPDPRRSAPLRDDCLTIKMDNSDIFRGSLLLVNHEHQFDIPDDIELVPVSDLATGSYRVSGIDIMLNPEIIGPLNDMMDAFYAETGRDNLVIISGFRDYIRQQEILDDYIRLVGSTEASKWASRPGFSEHHTGLAADFGLLSSGSVRTFTGTGVNSWFRENSYRFGFILRYTAEKEGITGTTNEPWHFRYVGEPHASIMFRNNWCLEEYIALISEYSFDERYISQYGENTFEMYYTRGTEVKIPFDYEFDISGNNTDGFFVTLCYAPVR